MKCEICDREALGTYCEPHEKAYDNLVRKYAVWKEALSMSWKEYLNEVINNEYTGAWVKEVAQQLIKSQGE